MPTSGLVIVCMSVWLGKSPHLRLVAWSVSHTVIGGCSSFCLGPLVWVFLSVLALWCGYFWATGTAWVALELKGTVCIPTRWIVVMAQRIVFAHSKGALFVKGALQVVQGQCICLSRVKIEWYLTSNIMEDYVRFVRLLHICMALQVSLLAVGWMICIPQCHQ